MFAAIKKMGYKKIVFILFTFILAINFAFISNKIMALPDSLNSPENISTQVTNKSNVAEKAKISSFFNLENLKQIFSPEKSVLYLFILAFLIGLITSFTPCVYPMIPITLGILQTQASGSVLRNFMLSVSYVLGISTIYAFLGYLAATTAIMFGQWLANPWLIFFIILFFIYLAFSMFGFYEIKMPRFLTKRENVSVKGSYFYSYLFGLISGTVASPCLTPSLAIVLSFVAKAGSPVIGFFALFFFSLGMGILLILIGTFSASLSILPRAGMWMIEIKKFFGFVLLFMSIYFLQPLLGGFAAYKLYAILILISGVYYLVKAQNSKIKIYLGILLIISSLILTGWIIREKNTRRTRLLATNLKPDSMLVCLSTARHQRL
ncbi:MAG: thiol:disulfide interchange protein [candidate division TM6 bacterium GW2011_GWF2_28_16]|nr:MAG: thiol:disulfide interchange protein [candidate division TM6 bacterium GW2011_GWF2_28_16]